MTGELAPPFAAGVAAAGPSVLLQSRSLTTRLVDGAAVVLGLAVLAAGLAGGVALLYRWYARERVPGGLAILVGLSAVAVLLNTTRALGQVIGETGDPLDETLAIFNIVTVLVSVAAARAGTDVGDRLAAEVFESTADRLEGEVSRVVQAVGRVITVELPEEIDDIVGYDPVPAETTEQLAGKAFVFPRRLTVTELRDRLVTRLKADYAVGHVDIDVAADGTVEYLALGSRVAGIGPTLPPETSAVAVRADPPFAASAGDLVQVWETNPPERVLTAELRGTAGDVVTLAVDAADTRKLDEDTRYRLVTLPVESRPDREFASLLRAADETMATVTVAEGSALAGQPLGALGATVIAVRPPDGPVEPLPGRDRPLEPGEMLYLVATPETIRRVDAAVRTEDPVPSEGRPAAGSEMPPERRVDARTPVDGEPDGPGTVDGTPDASSEAAAVDSSPGTAAATPASDGQSDAPAAGESGTVGDGERGTDTEPGVVGGRGDAGQGDDPLFDEDTPGIETLEQDGRPDEDASAGEDERDDEAADGSDAVDDETADTEGGDETDSAAFDLGEPDLASVGDDGEQATESESDGGDGADATEGGAGDGVDESPSWTEITDDEPADPTTDDLEDLPGTDPDDLIGTDVDLDDDSDDVDLDDVDLGSNGSGDSDEAEESSE